MSPKAKKIRLDQLLVMRNLAPTIPKAQALILARTVKVDHAVLDRADVLVSADAEIQMKSEDHPYVSRGGWKLKGALECFAMSVKGEAVLDVGASTGGFTDCLLDAGARRVFAVDVGYGQLAWKLRSDPRVVVIERTNIRHYDGSGLDEKPTLAVIDVSFISLKTVIPAVERLIADPGRILALIKPQFEARRDEIGKNGVVENMSVRDRIVEDIRRFCESRNLHVAGTCESPLLGPAGNKEFFILAYKV
ncbi:MAG: TlyA family RNA methyltransferase [Deltaproteobacteria bacterium]|nr:TlyA family RNA methyltransferase [Deltaproteobacteria bacterium]